MGQCSSTIIASSFCSRLSVPAAPPAFVSHSPPSLSWCPYTGPFQKYLQSLLIPSHSPLFSHQVPSFSDTSTAFSPNISWSRRKSAVTWGAHSAVCSRGRLGPWSLWAPQRGTAVPCAWSQCRSALAPGRTRLSSPWMPCAYSISPQCSFYAFK